MMCSSWKISVFGILALMLAFGMTTDALAANGKVTVLVTGADALRATGTNNIRFVVSPTTAPDGDQDKTGTVTITIPGQWSRPIHIVGDTGEKPDGFIDASDLDAAGEVFITNGENATGSISGRSLIATFGKDSLKPVTFEYRSVNPRRMGTYAFALAAQYHDIDEDPANIMKRGGRFYLDISVGTVASGVGTFSITGLSGVYKHPDVEPKSEKDKYFLTSKQSIAGLNFVFKANGTMVKNSTISIDAAVEKVGWGGFYPGPAGSSAGKVTVSGDGVELDEAASTATKVIVKITDDRIEANHPVNIRIAGLEAPEVTGATAFDIRTFMSATTSRSNADDGSAKETGKDTFTFITTAAHGTGKVAMSTTQVTGDPKTRVTDSLVFAAAGEALGNLVFTFTELEGVYGLGTGKIEIDIPSGFAEPLKAFGDGDATSAGTVTIATFNGDVDATHELNGRKITVTLNAAAHKTSGGTVTYNGNIEAPKTEGIYTFTTRTMSGPHGKMEEIAASPMVVVGGHGKGTMTLTRNGQSFTQTKSGAEVGNLVFTYTPGGDMAVGSVVEVLLAVSDWSLFRTDNGDGVADRGEVTFTVTGDKAPVKVAAFKVAALGTMFTATATKVLTPSDKLVFTYKNVKVPTTGPRSDTFVTRTVSHSGVETNKDHEIVASPNVGIGRAADGIGSLDVNVTQADAGSSIGRLEFTYTAAGTMTVGSTVEITIPDSGGWPAPSSDVSQPGGVTLGDTFSASLTTTNTTMSATTATQLTAGRTIVFTYEDITAPTSGGQYTFSAKSTSSPAGTLRSLAAGVTIDVDEVVAGSIMLADASGIILSSASPGMALGNLAFTFTAGVQMAKDAQVQTTIPDDWTPPFIDNNDGVETAGEVSVAGMADLSVSGGGGIPWTLTATTTDALEIGNTLVITYKQVTAPADQVTYTFMTKSSVASGGTLLAISNPPQVIVRTLVDALAIHADPTSVFIRDDIIAVTVNLWSAAGELANALEAMAIMLSDGEAGGRFSDADGNAVTSITIADNTSSASATYSNAMAGMPTLTATSGDLTDSVDVTVKYPISNLMVNAVDMPDPVQGDATITVSANGRGGADVRASVVVTKSETDADGNEIVVVSTKSLDEDPDAMDVPEGDFAYTRDVDLGGLADGDYIVTVNIGDDKLWVAIEVVNDRTAPMLSEASAKPDEVADGDQVVLRVVVASANDITSVTADVSALDSTRTEPIALTKQPDAEGVYIRVFTIDMANDNDADGVVMVTFTATDRLGNSGESDPASITLRNDVTPPVLSMASAMPALASNGMVVTISVSSETGLTVTADASAIGGDAALPLAEGMDADMAGTGMYSADVTVTDAMGGEQMVSISASDAIGNAIEAVSASVSIHVVTSASFSPSDVSTGDTVTVSAMGTAGLTATFNVFDAEGTNIVTEGMLTESADAAGSYSGSFDVVIDVHPTGTYWVSVSIGQASMTAEGALTIDHLAQFDLMIGARNHLIHVPLDVTHIDGAAGTIDTVGDLYDALGDAVNFIISLGADGIWNSYLGDSSAGSVADPAIGDDTGLIAVMSSAATLKLAGNALGTGGVSTISLSAGNNLVGVPLDDGDPLSMISDALSPLVSAVVVSNDAGNGFNTIAQAGDPGDGAIMGGVGYIVIAAATARIPVVGVAWDNSGMMEDAGATVAMNGGAAANGNGASTAPSIGFQTPVLQVQGKLIDQVGMMSLEGLNVGVKNLSSGTVLGHTTATDDYSMTFVKLDSSAAKVGDVLEIKADSPNPLLGVRPVQHVVTAEDVINSRISLPDLVTYEIPAQTELLANYPNPFNPETWIPFRLAEDASVSLTIYGASGSLVRTIDIGFTPAAVYQGRSEAIYWDGRNDFGEQISSGIYFYHLNAGDFSATRKMVIVK